MKETFIIGLAIFHIAAAASLPWSEISGGGEEIEVVNGDDIDISKVPYQVALTRGGQFVCGGSIINANFILTAAHCVDPNELGYVVRAGSSKWSAGGVLVKVANVTIHSKYVKRVYDYDIAILKLQKPLTFGKQIASAKLADKSYEVKDGESVLITGWGITQIDEGTLAVTLQGVELPKISFERCEKVIRELFRINLTKNYICALHPDDGHNACQGDSGGPLAHKGTQVGVVSFGGPCNRHNAPVAYTSVAIFRDWIDSVAGKL